MFDALSTPRPTISPTRTPAREEELAAGVRESLDYQIRRRTLGIAEQDAPGEAAREIHEAAAADQALSSASVARMQSGAEPHDRSGLHPGYALEQSQLLQLRLDLQGRQFRQAGQAQA